VITGEVALVLMPFYSKGTLQVTLEQLRSSKKFLHEKEILNMFLSCCKGLSEFHKQNLSHNDIKPGNLLVSENDQLILFDFGSVGPAKRPVTSRKQALALQEWALSNCTPLYKPPELFDVQSDALIDERTDIWSLGCTLYAMAFNCSPFETGAVSGSVALAVTSGKIDIPNGTDKRLSSGFLELMLSMMNSDIRKRPFIGEVIDKTAQILKSSSVDDVRVDIQ